MFNVNGIDSAVIVELFESVAPRTCDNFLALCKGLKNKDGETISYAASEVHRIVKGMFIQMGKIKCKNPDTKFSKYGGEFPDESFQIKHTEVGLLGMCKKNGLKHTNESQFYITTGAPLSYLDGENVVFGRVISGMQCIRLIEQMETMNERPTEAVKICKTSKYNKE
jgi:peptidyl-prolyl isomerase D